MIFIWASADECANKKCPVPGASILGINCLNSKLLTVNQIVWEVTPLVIKNSNR